MASLLSGVGSALRARTPPRRMLDEVHGIASWRKGRSRLGIRGKLAVGFLVAIILPLALFALITLQSTQAALCAHADAAMRSRGEGLRAALDARRRALLDQVVSYGEWTALGAAVERRDRAWLEGNATTWVVDNSEITGAQVLTPDGDLVSAAGDFARRSLVGSPVVAAARATGRPGTDFRVLDGTLFIVGAGPIIDQGVPQPAARGLVVYGERLDRARLAELAAIVGVRQLDLFADGRLAASSARSAAATLPPGTPRGTTLTVGSDNVFFTELRDASGESQAVIALRVDSGLASVTGDVMQATATYALLVAVGISLLAAVVVARWLSQPLNELAQAARALAAGKLQQRVAITSRDEFGEVAAAFNSMAAKLSQVIAELRRSSDRDGLTGLFNRRAMFRTLAMEMARGRRYAAPFSILLIDVDDLKLINDAHGHPAGDRLLRQVSRLLAGHAREADLVGRIGGDEFMLILPETRPAAATALAERIRGGVAAQPYVTADGERIPLRLSIGAASFPEDGCGVSELVAHADAALYSAKHGAGSPARGWGEDLLRGEGATALAMLESLVLTVDHKDSYTRRHSEEVSGYALLIAERLGFAEERLRLVRLAGLVHDVGKIGVPRRILRKPGRLTPAELEVMRRHPLLGEHLVQGVPHGKEIGEAVAAHHERWDGGGYPRGLAGEAIPLLGRIIAVADAYSAMTSDRPYRAALSRETAIVELRAGAGRQFEPALVELLVAALEAAETIEAPELLAAAPPPG